MKTTNSVYGFLAIGFLALAVMGSPSQATAANPTPTQAACQMNIQNSAATITKTAYITSKSHTKVEYVRGTVYNDDSFDLTYNFFYRDSDNDPQWYTLRFVYNSRGTLKDVKTVGHSSFWEPFNALKIAGAVADSLAKDLDKK